MDNRHAVRDRVGASAVHDHAVTDDQGIARYRKFCLMLAGKNETKKTDAKKYERPIFHNFHTETIRNESIKCEEARSSVKKN